MIPSTKESKLKGFLEWKSQLVSLCIRIKSNRSTEICQKEANIPADSGNYGRIKKNGVILN
jgi:hypothetical protein